VSAEGDAPLRYQWLRNGQPLRGETDATLRLAAVSPVDAGAYSVVVSNPAGSVESDPALLGIVLPTLPFADLFAQRGRITTPTGVGTADNRNAGREPGEPRHAGKPGGHSVWITWRAPTSGHITFRTTGSTFDTLLAVYVAARDGTRVEIASDEDSGGFLNSLVRFNALEGTEYLIAVDGYAGATGTIVLSWDLDFRLAAFPSILQQPVSTLGIVGGPARFAVAADPPGVTFQWFFQGKALAGQTEPVLLLPAVSPTLAGAYAVAVSLPGGTSVVSRTVILEVADRPQTAAALSADKLADLFGEDEFGSTAGFPSGAPPGLALLSTRPASSAPPAVGLPGSQWTDNSDSTRSPDEPAVCDVVTTATRWFRLRFNLPGGVEQPVKITTTGSEIATLLAVFTNNAAPLMIACDRAEPPLITSAEVQIGARRNVDYLVLVDGLDGAQGRIKLNWDGEELAPPAVEIREGRFRVEMRVTPGTYDWQHGSALDTWLDLFRTNVASGVFQYHAPRRRQRPGRFLPPEAGALTWPAQKIPSGSYFRPRTGSLGVFNQRSNTAAYTRRKSTLKRKSPFARSPGASDGWVPSNGDRNRSPARNIRPPAPWSVPPLAFPATRRPNSLNVIANTRPRFPCARRSSRNAFNPSPYSCNNRPCVPAWFVWVSNPPNET
jgi:hypothetical protein